MARFKKGSAAAKAYMAKIRGMTSHSKKRGANNVARKRRSFSRRRVSRRRYGRSNNGMSWSKILIGGGLYGAARAPLAAVTTPLVQKVGIVPSGYEDEVGNAIVSYLAMKYGSGMIRDIGHAGLIVETARVASSVSSGFLSGSTSTSSGTLF
jgi:hypothetical protein